MEQLLLWGGVVGQLAVPIGQKTEDIVEKHTNLPAGNANIRSKIEIECEGQANQQECIENFEFPTSDKVNNIVITPILEEVFFRTVPSFVLDKVNHEKEPLRRVLFGAQEGMGMTRRELVVGITMSLLFGVAHNATPGGLDTKTVPAWPTLGGLIYWYLQRKLGVFANITAHTSNNFAALRQKWY